jgi:multiple RNA-binding domain-containing protein 1
MTLEQPTSRIIVKNLPKWCTEDQLRKSFSAKGQVTDVKLMYTRSGVFRRFAFIGFVSVDEAVAAVKYFNRTFIDTSRVEVDFAYKVDSAFFDALIFM